MACFENSLCDTGANYSFVYFFAYYFNWVLEDRLCPLIFAIARNMFAVSTALQILQTSSEGVLRTFCVDDRVQAEKPSLAALCSSAVHLIDSSDIKEMLYDHS